MTTLFISYSHKDRSTAVRFYDKLVEMGFGSLFWDQHPESGIPAGSKWERELYQKLRLCKALIVLLSPNWIESKWCFAELAYAKAMGKAYFPIEIAETPDVPPQILERQLVRLSDHDVWNRLKRGFAEADLTTENDFPWPVEGHDECPYLGLQSFEGHHAGVYFGRENETQELRERLNQMVDKGHPRMLYIVGASGSGKSSLVKAGLLPILQQKENTRWCVLKTFRWNELRSKGRDWQEQVAYDLLSAWPQDDLQRPAWKTLRQKYRQPAPKNVNHFIEDTKELLQARQQPDATPVFILDQFEEILLMSESESAREFLEFLSCLILSHQSPWRCIATIRTDFFDTLQTNPDLIACREQANHYSLYLMKRERFYDVIRRPAEKVGIRFESDALVDRMVSDTATKDALPLLSFTLREMYERCGQDRVFRLDEYRDKIGGLEGCLARVADELLQEAIASNNTSPDVLERKLHLVFSNHLVGINDNDQFVRRTAVWSELPVEARPILELFIERRLITSRRQEESDPDSEHVIEVSHEALFRRWEKLSRWLDERRDLLRWRADVERSRTAAEVNWKGLNRSQLAISRDWPRTRPEELTAEEKQWINSAKRRVTFVWSGLGLTALLFAALALFLSIALRNATRSESARIQTFVESLKTARPAEFHALLKGQPINAEIYEILNSTQSKNEEETLRIRLAQFERHPEGHVEFLKTKLLKSESPDQFLMIRESLQSQRSKLVEDLWEIAQNNDDLKLRFRAACALAEFSPADARWKTINRDVVDQLLSEDRLLLEGWLSTLANDKTSPVLLSPLRDVFLNEERMARTRELAAEAIAKIAADEPEDLCKLLVDATPGQYQPLFDSLIETSSPASVVLSTMGPIVKAPAETQLKKIPLERKEAQRIRIGRRKANAAATLMYFGHHSEALRAFQITDDPEAISQFIEFYVQLAPVPSQVISALDSAVTSDERYTLLLTLESLPDLTPAERSKVIAIINSWYANNNFPPAIIHSASLWLMRQWEDTEQEPTIAEMTGRKYDGKTDWYVEDIKALKQPLTFIVFDGGEFRKGALPDDLDKRKSEKELFTSKIEHKYAMCNKEVTVGEFEIFAREFLPELTPDIQKYVRGYYELDESDPMIFVRWYDAVLYCRWLTTRAGLGEEEQCYHNPLTHQKGLKAEMYDRLRFGEEPHDFTLAFRKDELLKDNYRELKGFRLPTEDEWENACRDGRIVTKFSFGSDTELLTDYGVADSRSAQPVMSLRPNLSGLFDIHGNVREWCQGWNNRDKDLRPLRGGGWEAPARQSRCPRRSSDLPDDQDAGNGFRIVKTIIEESSRSNKLMQNQ